MREPEMTTGPYYQNEPSRKKGYLEVARECLDQQYVGAAVRHLIWYLERQELLIGERLAKLEAKTDHLLEPLSAMTPASGSSFAHTTGPAPKPSESSTATPVVLTVSQEGMPPQRITVALDFSKFTTLRIDGVSDQETLTIRLPIFEWPMTSGSTKDGHPGPVVPEPLSEDAEARWSGLDEAVPLNV